MQSTERPGGLARRRARPARSGRWVWLGLALLGLAWAGGCAKREWVAARRAAVAWPAAPPVYGTAPVDTAAAAAAGVLDGPDAVAGAIGAPGVAFGPDPVSSGGLPLAGSAARVGAELPWADPAAPGPAGTGPGVNGRTSPVSPKPGAAAADCRRQPCFWVQVAALADSSGAASSLARARSLAAGGALTGPAPGTALVWERGFWKLRLGPYPSWEQADAALRAVRAGGFAQAWLVRPRAGG